MKPEIHGQTSLFDDTKEENKDEVAVNIPTYREAIEEIENKDEITLNDTVEYMNSDDYKERFLAEYMQLKIRYNNLHKMLVKYDAGTLEFEPTCDHMVLEDQEYYMLNYLKTLEVRAEMEGLPLPKNI